jgi:hypothetical protein
MQNISERLRILFSEFAHVRSSDRFVLFFFYGFPVLPDFLRSSGSGTGFIQPREYN